MVARCALCKEKITYTFLNKPEGTWIRNQEGKKYLICSQCQRQYSLDEIRKQLS